jgi:hypothetical protein
MTVWDDGSVLWTKTTENSKTTSTTGNILKSLIK